MQALKNIPAASKALILSVFVGFILMQPARALTFNITYDASVTSQANAAQIESAFNFATQVMQTLYTNNSSVNITVYWGGASLGASITEMEGYLTYSQMTNALYASR